MCSLSGKCKLVQFIRSATKTISISFVPEWTWFRPTVHGETMKRTQSVYWAATLTASLPLFPRLKRKRRDLRGASFLLTLGEKQPALPDSTLKNRLKHLSRWHDGFKDKLYKGLFPSVYYDIVYLSSYILTTNRFTLSEPFCLLQHWRNVCVYLLMACLFCCRLFRLAEIVGCLLDFPAGERIFWEESNTPEAL